MRRLGKQQLREHIEALNELLATAIPQHAKAKICGEIENLLFAADAYAGFNHNYWLEQGFYEWREDGEPCFPEKDRYITGPDGCKDRDYKSDYTATIQGEYSRTYYTGKLQ